VGASFYKGERLVVTDEAGSPISIARVAGMTAGKLRLATVGGSDVTLDVERVVKSGPSGSGLPTVREVPNR